MDGNTTIDFAAAVGHVAAFKLLWQACTDVNTDTRMTTLFCEIQAVAGDAVDKATAVASFIQGFWREQKAAKAAEASQMTSILIAAQRGQVEVVQLILQRDPDPANAATV